MTIICSPSIFWYSITFITHLYIKSGNPWAKYVLQCRNTFCCTEYVPTAVVTLQVKIWDKSCPLFSRSVNNQSIWNHQCPSISHQRPRGSLKMFCFVRPTVQNQNVFSLLWHQNREASYLREWTRILGNFAWKTIGSTDQLMKLMLLLS